jgi:hypothetical protein
MASAAAEENESIQGTILSKISFHGSGKFTVSRNRIECSEEIDVVVTRKGDKSELKITGCSESGNGAIATWNLGGICISNSAISSSAISSGDAYVGGPCVIDNLNDSVISGTCIVNGLNVSDLGRGRTKINGVRYAPYKVRTGPYAGKSVLIPDGYTLKEPQETASVPPTPAAVQSKSHSFDISKSTVSLTNVAASGNCYIVFEGDTLFSPLSVDVQSSGSSSITVSSTCRMDHLYIGCSGASSIIFSAIAKNAVLETSGASKISGPHGTGEVTAQSSGASRISATAEKEATISRDKSGASRLNVERIHRDI